MKSTMTSKHFAAKRKQLRMTAKQLAAELGISHARLIYAYESGEANITKTIEILLEKVLNDHTSSDIKKTGRVERYATRDKT